MCIHIYDKHECGNRRLLGTNKKENGHRIETYMREHICKGGTFLILVAINFRAPIENNMRGPKKPTLILDKYEAVAFVW